MSSKNDKMGWKISSTLFFSLLAVAINYGITFVLTSYITNSMGAEAYGFVSLAKTIANYGIILTSCLNAYSARYITLAYHNNEIKKAGIYYSSIIFANIALALFTILFGGLFIYKLEWFVKIPNELLNDVRVLFLLNIMNYMCLTLANSFSASAYIKNRLDILEKIKIVAYIFEVFILLVLFNWLQPKVYYVGIALFSSTILLGVLNYRTKKIYTPDITISGRLFSWSAVKDLFLSGIWNSINSIGNMLNSGLDLWVSNLMLSALAMGQLSIVKTISTIFSTMINIIAKPFQPYLLKKYAQNDKKGLINIFCLEIKFLSFLSNMLFAGLFVYGLLYYKLWTPSQDSSILYNITIVTIIGLIFEGMVHPLFYVYTLSLKNRIPCFVTITSGLLNVLGMYLLLSFTSLQLYAVVGTTTILGFVVYLIFTPLYSAKCIEVKWNTFYPPIVRGIISTIIITVVLYLISKIYMPTSWATLLLCAILDCVICFPIHILCVFRPSEIRNIIKKS